jgi:PPOX class probable F420-dependent enzyme
MGLIPEEFVDLLERPLYVTLATVRPDGAPQSNPMWCRWDGEFLYFTNTTTRQKYKNVRAEPRVAVSVFDPERPFRYLEVRGVVERIEEDPTGAMYLALAERYGISMQGPPRDAANRVVYVVRPTATSHQG